MLKDLKRGKEAEEELREILSALGLSEAKLNDVFADRYEFDVSGNIAVGEQSVKLTFEVKNDIMSAKTGNLAIEYWNSKKNAPSGLFRTTADYWVHRFNDELYIITVSQLKSLTKTLKPDRLIVAGGDDNADLLIYRIERLENEMRKVSSFASALELYEYLKCCPAASNS